MALSYREIRTDRQWKAATGPFRKKICKLVELFSGVMSHSMKQLLKRQVKKSVDDLKFKAYDNMLFFILCSLNGGLTYDVLALSWHIQISGF
jgi:hypothetical protein